MSSDIYSRPDLSGLEPLSIMRTQLRASKTPITSQHYGTMGFNGVLNRSPHYAERHANDNPLGPLIFFQSG